MILLKVYKEKSPKRGTLLLYQSSYLIKSNKKNKEKCWILPPTISCVKIFQKYSRELSNHMNTIWLIVQIHKMAISDLKIGKINTLNLSIPVMV